MKIMRAPFGVAVVCTLLCLVAIPVRAQTLKFRGISLDASPQTFIDKLGAPDKSTHSIAYLDYIDAPDKIPKNGARGIGDTRYGWNSMGVAGYDAAVSVEFWKDHFAGATYLIRVAVAANNQEQLGIYVNSYNDLLDKLTKLYGKPTTVQQPERIGSDPFSVLLGSEIVNSAPYTSTWSFENGQIMCDLSLDPKTTDDTLIVTYLPKWLLGKLEAYRQQQKANTNGL